MRCLLIPFAAFCLSSAVASPLKVITPGLHASSTGHAAYFPKLLRLVSDEKITMLPGPPTVFQTILNHPDIASFDLSSLRSSVTGGCGSPSTWIAMGTSLEIVASVICTVRTPGARPIEPSKSLRDLQISRHTSAASTTTVCKPLSEGLRQAHFPSQSLFVVQ